MMIIFVLLAILLAMPGSARAQAADMPLAPELTGLGTIHLAVTTSVPRAQRFFDQGLRLLYAFNHPESLRAFREAARLDPELAMAYWGQAMAVGPNLNAPLTPENSRLAHDAITRALTNVARVTERERALVQALAARYSADPAADRKALDTAYANGMRTAAERFPADPDVQTLYADAVMNVSPWDYWDKNGKAKSGPALAIKALEGVLARHPDHAGALHYHIHALEASKEPERAEGSADRLAPLMPAAGHIVHMPAHIYIRVGRYKDAAEANERAIVADEDYLAQCQAQGLYPVTYYPHNLHFLWAAATLEGRQAVAIDAARKTAAKVPHHHAGALAWTADFPVTPMLAYARFGRWRDALTEPRPPDNQPYAIGIWHYSRALAFVGRRDLERAAAELARLKVIMDHEAFKTTLKELPLLTNLEIASRMAQGELAARRGRIEEAVRVLKEAVALDDAFPYNEPPVWHHPPRQVLGAVLLEAGQPREAETVYRQDLEQFRENGWSLFGLMRSLEAQGRRADADAAKQRFSKAWSRSDIVLRSSRIMEDDRMSVASFPTIDLRAGFSRTDSTLSSGITLEYVRRGDPSGAPVLFLDGFTDSWRSFEWMLAYLPTTINAYAISVRGHGGSDRPAHGYDAHDFARDIDGFMERLQIPSAVVAGHSMGSGIALQLALDYPSRTRALVLMGAMSRWSGTASIDELTAVVAGFTDTVDPAFVREFQLSTVATPVPDIIEVAVEESLRVPARVWKEAFAGIVQFDVSKELSEIEVPALVVWGSKETIATFHEQEALVRGLKRARLVVYEHAGHAVHWDEPQRTARDIARFVAEMNVARGL
jgi:pimeloyl-ACP methyl ester carboxylesterase/tetratricopeptide (TPR) repeat protein